MSTPEQIWSDRPLPAWAPGWSVTVVASTGSTNDDLSAAAAHGAPDRSVLVTGHQTAGRGRLDRRWDAPPGANLLVSILFRDVPAVANTLTHRVGLAAIDACREATGVSAWLKWPNDLLIGDRKLAGILAQRLPDGPVVVGLGLNVRWAPEGAARLPDDVAPLDVLASLLAAYDRLPTAGGALHARYRDSLSTLGRRVRVEVPTGEVDGTAVDVTPEGRLVVLDTCGVTHRLDVGDVIHVHPGVPPS